MASLDSFKSRQKLVVGDKTYDYFSLRPRRTGSKASRACPIR